MMVHIVTNHATMNSVELPFRESIKVFTDYKKAVEQFNKWRTPDPMFDAFTSLDTPKLGVKTFVKGGKDDVELFTTEITE